MGQQARPQSCTTPAVAAAAGSSDLSENEKKIRNLRKVRACLFKIREKMGENPPLGGKNPACLNTCIYPVKIFFFMQCYSLAWSAITNKCNLSIIR